MSLDTKVTNIFSTQGIEIEQNAQAAVDDRFEFLKFLGNGKLPIVCTGLYGTY